jgi:hypothetical protein
VARRRHASQRAARLGPHWRRACCARLAGAPAAASCIGVRVSLGFALTRVSRRCRLQLRGRLWLLSRTHAANVLRCGLHQCRRQRQEQARATCASRPQGNGGRTSCWPVRRPSAHTHGDTVCGHRCDEAVGCGRARRAADREQSYSATRTARSLPAGKGKRCRSARIRTLPPTLWQARPICVRGKPGRRMVIASPVALPAYRRACAAYRHAQAAIQSIGAFWCSARRACLQYGGRMSG